VLDHELVDALLARADAVRTLADIDELGLTACERQDLRRDEAVVQYDIRLLQRAQAVQHPGLAGGLVDLFTAQMPDGETWAAWHKDWEAAFTAAGQAADFPPRLHPGRRNYYARAMEALFKDQPAAALWLLLRTWTLAVVTLGEAAPSAGYEDACAACGLDGAEFSRRLEELDAYLDAVEETLDIWAQKNGV